VEPTGAEAFTIFAEAMDRSGFARGTLAIREGAEAPVPERRERHLLTMADMGHGDHGAMDHDEMNGATMDPAEMGHSAMDHAAMGHAMDDGPMQRAPGTVPPDVTHGADEHGAANAGVAMTATSRIDDPGNGLGDDGWRVLTYADLEALERELHRGARGVALSHAVNVTGALLPIAEASALAHAHDAVVLVDAAQTAGWLPLPTADLVAFAGHKGPQAPWGIGGLVARPGLAMVTPAAVCTLGDGPSCAPMPGYCDAGSVDRVALAGLAAGLRWMADQDYALERARVQVSLLETRVRHKGGTVLGPPSGERMPTVAFTTDRPVAELGQALAAEGIIASAGLQCSPVAHETLGTAPDGVVRLSVGPLVTDDAIDATIEVLDAVL